MRRFKTTLLLTLFCVCMFSACKKSNPRDKLIGTFNALGACQPNPYQVILEPSTVGDDYVNIKNVYADSAVILGIVINEDNVSVKSQIVGSDTYKGDIIFNDRAKNTGEWYVTKNGINCSGLLTRVQ